MKLEQFLESPSPKGGIKIPTNELITKHRESYNKVKGKIRSNVYTTDRKTYIVLVRIPSGEVKDFNYDCIIQFNKIGNSLEDSDIKIFSNSPSFASWRNRCISKSMSRLMRSILYRNSSVRKTIDVRFACQ